MYYSTVMKKFYERYWDGKESLGDLEIKWPVLQRYIPREKNVSLLDFGCGKGFLLSKIALLNPNLKLVGVDVSKTAITTIKNTFPSGNFLHIAENGKIPFKDNAFDFIVAADVLEHIYDTTNALSELTRVLKPNGRIFISVPYHGMIKNIIATFVGFDFYFDPKQAHIRFYTKKNLFKVVNEAGLKILKHGYYGRFYPISHGQFVFCEKSNISG